MYLNSPAFAPSMMPMTSAAPSFGGTGCSSCSSSGNPMSSLLGSPMGGPMTGFPTGQPMGDSGMGSLLAMQQQMMQTMMGLMSSLLQGAFGGQQNAGGLAGGLPSVPSFGGPSSGGGGGLNSFLGGPSSGGGARKARARKSGGAKKGGVASKGGTSNASGASNVSAVGDAKGASWGKKLASYAKGHATGSGGWCFKYASESLRKFGVQTSGASAYMAAPQLAKSDKFKEVKMSPSQFKKLPPGAVVVWNKGAGHPHGHISIALGGGKEASDVLRDQITNYGTSARVFIPK